VAALHALLPSRSQVAEQPSPETLLPSSHASMPSRTTWSPQMAGAPSVELTATSSPATRAIAC
jgi:hypothetical protein